MRWHILIHKLRNMIIIHSRIKKNADNFFEQSKMGYALGMTQ